MKKIYPPFLVCIVILIYFTSCISENKITSMNKIIVNNKNSEIRIIPLDSMFIDWLNTAVDKKNQWNWCIQIKEKQSASHYVKEYYSNLLYFKGELNQKGEKIGNWEGYYNDKVIIKTTYIGSESKTTPPYVEFYDSNGKLIKKLNFSIVN